jgi:uncharacterized protein YdeI (YjbR/CyaY-like superfamily)
MKLPTPNIHPSNRKEWRAWLKKNHKKEKKVYLILYKRHTGKPTITHKESMEEAICFGWIDTIVKKIDDARYTRCFVQRNSNSRWSNATQRYAQALVKQKKMAAYGLKMYQEGLQKPVIDHDLPKNPDTPEELTKALNLPKNKKAKENFHTFAPSYRRHYIYWIEKAKRPETKNKRILEVIKRAKENKKQ